MERKISYLKTAEKKFNYSNEELKGYWMCAYNKVLKTTKQHEMSEDIAQEVMVDLARGKIQIPDKRYALQRIAKIAYYKTIDELRSKYGRRNIKTKEINFSDFSNSSEEFSDKFKDKEKSPLEKAILNEQMRGEFDAKEPLISAILCSYGKMKELVREFMRLNGSIEKTAESLGISKGSVRGVFFRNRKYLKEAGFFKSG